MDQMKKAPNAKHDNRFLKGFLTGGAVGIGIGGLGGYFLARKKVLKRAKEDLKKAYKRGYDKGTDEATKEAQEWISENVVVASSYDPADIQKAIDEHFDKPETHNEEKARVETVEPRTMIEAYDHALEESAENMDEWNLSIDGEDSQKRSEERERYLELIDKYQQHPEDGPMHISRKDFEEECYLDKDWVTYYAGDNVFASDKDADSKMDAFANFGVVNGNDLFTGPIVRIDDDGNVIEDDDNDDPNITYIRNFRLNTVYEITRTVGSYEAMRSGEVFLENGQSG